MRSEVQRQTPNRVPSITRATVEARQKQDSQTQALGSEQSGVLVRSDPDQLHFLTPALKNMHIVGIGGGNVGATTTLAYMPESQQSNSFYSPVYETGTTFSLDRAGDGNTGLNIIRPGQEPLGYYSGGVAIQKRVKKYFRKPRGDEDPGDDTIFRFAYDVATEMKPKGYLPQVGEQLDGGFYTPSAYLGIERPSGNSFPADDNGDFLMNPDPWGPDGWSGTVVHASGPKPQIDSVSPDTISADGVGNDPPIIEITGEHFTNCSWVLVGPFHPVVNVFVARDPVDLPDTGPIQHNTLLVQPDGAYYYRRVVDDEKIEILCPLDVIPGQYDVLVIGSGGKVGIKKNAITIVE